MVFENTLYFRLSEKGRGYSILFGATTDFHWTGKSVGWPNHWLYQHNWTHLRETIVEILSERTGSDSQTMLLESHWQKGRVEQESGRVQHFLAEEEEEEEGNDVESDTEALGRNWIWKWTIEVVTGNSWVGKEKS